MILLHAAGHGLLRARVNDDAPGASVLGRKRTWAKFGIIPASSSCSLVEEASMMRLFALQYSVDHEWELL